MNRARGRSGNLWARSAGPVPRVVPGVAVSLFAAAFACFAALVGALALQRVRQTWGPATALGLGGGLLGVWFVLPLGGLLCVGLSLGSLVFADKEAQRRIRG